MALVVATEFKNTVQLFYLKTGKNKCILSTEMHTVHMCVMIRSRTCADFNIYTFYFHTRALINIPFALPPKFLA